MKIIGNRVAEMKQIVVIMKRIIEEGGEGETDNDHIQGSREMRCQRPTGNPSIS